MEINNDKKVMFKVYYPQGENTKENIGIWMNDILLFNPTSYTGSKTTNYKHEKITKNSSLIEYILKENLLDRDSNTFTLMDDEDNFLSFSNENKICSLHVEIQKNLFDTNELKINHL
ncbi:hypothetical protein MHH56_23930 [Paenibacillus sp. FSL K6-3182]|uniref:hypothetical protein n=1 Tax=Paenibacillus sp. FSL K6-3182 TaxID=2921495 RepID=UPI0030D22BB4